MLARRFQALVLGLMLACGANPPAFAAKAVVLGADLSFVNELEDCGVVYHEDGHRVDPFEVVKAHGGNLVRVRIWNDAEWTHYSNLADVEKTLARAKAAGLQTLLDFHYSDDWADGDKQIIPKAWAAIDNTPDLAKALYQYTFDTLKALNDKGLMPTMVQVGNETNPELLGQKDWGTKRPIDWPRNAALFNAGIRAVRDAGKATGTHPQVMLHIAQPENAEPWFASAAMAGVTDYDWIGLSYYAKWSTFSMEQLGATIANLRQHYKAQVMVVETAYPFTLENGDESANLLGEDALVAGYPATPDGQKRYLIDLTQAVLDHGGAGTVYWEPDWVSSSCKTRWGSGSGWENAAWFDFRHDNAVLPAVDFMQHRYKTGP